MNYRIYVEKKKIFNVESEELFNEIRNDMLITNIENRFALMVGSFI